jgi:hypothetical protein
MWLLAVIFLSSGFLLILFLLRNKTELPTVGPWTLGNVFQLVSAVLTILALAIAVAALQMAATSSRQTQKAIEKQQEGLTASKEALEAVVETVQSQNAVVERNVAISKAQLDLIQQQSRLEQDRLDRKPIVELFFNDSNVNNLTNPIEIRPATDSVRVHFVVRNNGEAAAQKGTIVVIADSPAILVDQAGRRMPERRSHHRFQTGMPDLLAHTQTQDDFFLDLDLHGSLPEEFSLSLSVFGENFEAVRSRIRFRLVG